MLAGIYNDELPVEDECYNLFNAWSGGGKERWTLKVYGSKRVEVELNGIVLNQSDPVVSACGAIGWTTSPLQSSVNHSIFELSFAASPGSFGVQLHDPGPRFACSVLETEPVNFIGEAMSESESLPGSINIGMLLEDDFDKALTKLPSPWSFESPTITVCIPGETEESDGCTKLCHAGDASSGDCKPLPVIGEFEVTNKDYEVTIGEAVENVNIGANHVCDGEFTGYNSATGKLDEWHGIKPAIGRFTNAFFNYDGERLHILNDWIFNGKRTHYESCTETPRKMIATIITYQCISRLLA